jgi:hypothetical protein
MYAFFALVGSKAIQAHKNSRNAKHRLTTGEILWLH